MTLSLWRGEQLLGELRELEPLPDDLPRRPGKPPALSAVLISSGKNPMPESVWQTYAPGFGMGVQQHPIEPDIVEERASRFRNQQSNAASGALEPMTPEQITGVPPEVQLTIRDEKGRVWLPQQIELQETRFGSAQPDLSSRGVPPEAWANGTIWFVLAVFLSKDEAPTSE